MSVSYLQTNDCCLAHVHIYSQIIPSEQSLIRVLKVFITFLLCTGILHSSESEGFFTERQ